VLAPLVRKRLDVGNAKNRIVNGEYDFGSVFDLVKEPPDRFTEPEYQEVLNVF